MVGPAELDAASSFRAPSYFVTPNPRRAGPVRTRAGGPIGPALVVAAQAGDRRAVDDLVAAGLPLVYTLVHRVLGAGPDADDVVQDVMLRALRQLPTLHRPESFRSWLTTIAV